MPVYEYQCQACHQEFEYQQRMSDPDKTVCEACGGKLDRLISRTAFQLKGSGWYKDLYSSQKPAGGSADTASTGGSSAPADKGSTAASGDAGGASGTSGGTSGTGGGTSGGTSGTGGGTSGGSSGGGSSGSGGGASGGTSSAASGPML